MCPIHRTATLIALIFIFCDCLRAQADPAEEKPYRMPQYSDGNPPPARTREEVSRLLAGAAKPESITKNISSSSLRLVLVAGPKDHNKGEHDYPAWQKVWSRLLKLAPDTMVDTAWEFPSSQQIDQADVLGTA